MRGIIGFSWPVVKGPYRRPIPRHVMGVKGPVSLEKRIGFGPHCNSANCEKVSNFCMLLYRLDLCKINLMKPKGKKNDSEKVPLQLIPGNALFEVGKVLRFGARKYAAHNWREGLDYSRLTGACFRHLTAYNEGEDLDPETQLSHVAHLACEALFLLEFITQERSDLDDRYKAKKQPNGKTHHNARKLSAEARNKLRLLYATTPINQNALAKQFGISQPAVSSLVKGIKKERK